MQLADIQRFPRALAHQAPPLAMLAVASILLLDALAQPVFNDDAVVDFHVLAMAPSHLASGLCRATEDSSLVELAAVEDDAPIELAYAADDYSDTDAGTDDEAATMSIFYAAVDGEPLVFVDAQALAESERVAHEHSLPFAPLTEPVFETDVTPFVIVKNESGDVVSSGWMPPKRGELAWLMPSPRRQAPIGSALFEEYLARIDRLRQDPYAQELERDVGDDEALARMLDDAGLERRDLAVWLQAIGESGEISPLDDAGRRISIFIDKRDRTLRQLAMDLDDTSMLVAMRRGSSVVADRVPIPFQSRIKVAGGEINTTLYFAATKAGVPEATIAEIAEILGWELDFGTLRRGASFRVAYEDVVRLDTGEHHRGRVLAVDIADVSRAYEAYWYSKNGDANGAYYARDGRPLGGTFLRYPVSYTRISSFFSDARFHPIKKLHVPHYGVDFAAPTGTPVVAASDGVIKIASWQGGSGRLVRIKHDDTYESAYAHLSRIAAGIAPGVKVRQGQVVGFVGMSGLATGPHLHYAIFRNGRYVDPLKIQLGRHPVDPQLSKEEFQVALERVDDAYDRAGLGRDAVVQVSMANGQR